MIFKDYYITNKDGKSNCVIRSFCKLYNDEYDNVFNDLVNIAKKLNLESFNDVPVFEEYMRLHNTNVIESNECKIKDLNLDNGNYIVFCYDKHDYYHMVPIINNVLYDRDDKSLELYVIKMYKQNK